MRKDASREGKLVLGLIALIIVVLVVLFILLVNAFTNGGDSVTSETQSSEVVKETKYAREGEYSEIMVLPVGRYIAMSENSKNRDKGVRVLFNFPNGDEDSYIFQPIADNEVNFVNVESGAILQMRVVNQNGVIMDKYRLSKNLPDLKPYDWNGYSVYEWTEHGDNKNFYLHYFFESKDTSLGWGFEFVAAMAYVPGATTDYEWGKEIFRRVKVEEVTVSE